MDHRLNTCCNVIHMAAVVPTPIYFDFSLPISLSYSTSNRVSPRYLCPISIVVIREIKFRLNSNTGMLYGSPIEYMSQCKSHGGRVPNSYLFPFFSPSFSVIFPANKPQHIKPSIIHWPQITAWCTCEA